MFNKTSHIAPPPIGTTCVALPVNVGRICSILKKVNRLTRQLGFVKDLRHPELVSGSQDVGAIFRASLRGAKRRGNPLKTSPLPLGADCEPRLEQFCKEPKALLQNAELPFNASNQAEGRILNELASCKNSGEGKR